MTDPIRLSKRLAELAGCSRREAELYIEGGWDSVDGQIVEEPHFKVADETVALHPEAVLTPQEPITLLLHKPAGQTPEQAEQLLNKANQSALDLSAVRPLQRHFERLTLCLPLDTDACGLQVFTQNWSVSRMAYTNHAMHGRMICMFSTCATAISFFPTSRRWRTTV